MLMIRLAPRGKKNKPFYRIVVSEKTKDLFGNYLEALGYYNPMDKEKTVHLEVERIQYWLSKGAQASPSVHNLLVRQQVGGVDPKKIVKAQAKKREEVAKKK